MGAYGERCDVDAKPNGELMATSESTAAASAMCTASVNITLSEVSCIGRLGPLGVEEPHTICPPRGVQQVDAVAQEQSGAERVNARQRK
jgi:hypothetical protein